MIGLQLIQTENIKYRDWNATLIQIEYSKVFMIGFGAHKRFHD